jgi:hypothetical protein
MLSSCGAFFTQQCPLKSTISPASLRGIVFLSGVEDELAELTFSGSRATDLGLPGSLA